MQYGLFMRMLVCLYKHSVSATRACVLAKKKGDVHIEPQFSQFAQWVAPWPSPAFESSQQVNSSVHYTGTPSRHRTETQIH
jgi:hypothetical protein